MGGPVCAACLAWLYTLSMHTLPPKCYQLITGARTAHPPEQVHNQNLDSVALNYPCPVN
jgi:hypothetical protein